MKKTYNQLLPKVDHLIKNYREDLLKHDRNHLDEYDGPFLHYTRISGTTILELCKADKYPAKGIKINYLFGQADRYHILNQVNECHDSLMNMGFKQTIHYFDGKVIKKVTRDQAQTIIREYTDTIKHEFTKDPNFVKEHIFITKIKP